MSRSQMPPINMRINRRAPRPSKSRRSVRLSETAFDHETKATRQAERLVIACRENVRFLNFHLQPYKKYLELPTLIDNALYLAYTIKVRDKAPIDALGLRKRLTEAGIETSAAFSFAPTPEEVYSGNAMNRIKNRPSRSNIDTRAFCLGCHQYMTILDLEHIVDTFEAIFSRLENNDMTSAGDQRPRNKD